MEMLLGIILTIIAGSCAALQPVINAGLSKMIVISKPS